MAGKLAYLALPMCAMTLVACSVGIRFKNAAANERGLTTGQDGSPSGFDAELKAAFAAAGIQTPQAPAVPPAPMVSLGKALFFDRIVSGNKNIACATCHHPFTHTGDALPISIGEGGSGIGFTRAIGSGRLIPRHAPGLFNLGAPGADTLMWDGNVMRNAATGALATLDNLLNGPSPTDGAIAQQLNSALATQALFPLTDQDQMLGLSVQHGGSASDELAAASTKEEIWGLIMTRLMNIPQYQVMFQQAFPNVTNTADFNIGHFGSAVAAFETAAWTELSTPLDHYLQGQNDALSDAEKRGAALFLGKAACVKCHNGPQLSDFGFHAIAMPQLGPGKANGDDLGRALVTNQYQDNYKFRTPPLRNVCLSGPWTHAGAYSSLESVVRHHLDPASALLSYDPSQVLRADLQQTIDTDPARMQARINAIDPILQNPISLSDAEVDDLLHFLCDSLTDASALALRSIETPPASVPSGLLIEN